MSLIEQIKNDTKEAMKNRDRQRLQTLRMLNAALKNGEIEAGKTTLSENEEQTILRRQLKQREESAEAFRNAGREEQAQAEAAEAEVVRSYLPDPLSRAEMEQLVDRAIVDTAASSMKDMGSVMSRAMALSENRAEGRELAGIVRSRLQ